jgi:low-affinity ferrous iron transport protein
MRFYKPIFCCEIEGAAETQQAAVVLDSKVDTGIVSVEETFSGYKVKKSPRAVDRWLDVVVNLAGSPPMFLFIVSGLVAWALMGIRFANSDIWVAVISDVQAILCYVFDSLLMRQLLREYSEQLSAMAETKSRCNSHRRMLAKVKEKLGPESVRHLVESYNGEALRPLDHGVRTQSCFAMWIIFSAKMFGHITVVGLYWIGIFIWLGFGHYCGWFNGCQLYINDATSEVF